MKTKLLFLLSLAFALRAHAGSATWNLNPTSSDWNTAANWTPNVVPNRSQDVATFDLSNQASVIISGQRDTVDHITFTANTSPYTITVGPDFRSKLMITGLGVVNNSSIIQNFVTAAGTAESEFGLIIFKNEASAGDGTAFTNEPGIANHGGGATQFFNNSSAGSAIFVNQAGPGFGVIDFFDHSSAANGTFTSEGGTAFDSGGLIQFFGSASAGNGIFDIEGGAVDFGFGAQMVFYDTSSAGTATVVLHRASAKAAGGSLGFQGSATADHATFTLEGSDFTASGASMGFAESATAGDATITLEGALQPEFGGAGLTFLTTSAAGNSTLIANSGAGHESGGTITFFMDSTGGTCRVELFGPVGSGTLFIEDHNPPGVTIGSLEGAGMVSLGANNLTVGTNNLSTIFSGLIQDGDSGNTGGSLTKIGSANLTITNANTYTGGTIISGGILIANNTGGSATGSGPVRVMAGTLGGSGTVAGPVVVGTGSGAGAILGPGNGTIPGTLTIQSKLKFKGDATYKVLINSNTLAADQVVANGIKIGGALIQFADFGTTVLPSGTSFTVISNTAASAIAGTFSNLADGSTTIIGPNTFQANYEGGDGNDLTLTVVP